MKLYRIKHKFLIRNLAKPSWVSITSAERLFQLASLTGVSMRQCCENLLSLVTSYIKYMSYTDQHKLLDSVAV